MKKIQNTKFNLVVIILFIFIIYTLENLKWDKIP